MGRNKRPGLFAPPVAVSVNEAARQLGVCRNTIYNMAKRGELRIVRLGETTKKVGVPYRDLIALVEGTQEAK